MVKGHVKGTNFERETCKALSRWWTSGERDDVFWRTDTSGGRATVRAKQGIATFGQVGDVQAVDPVGQHLIDLCTIELKRGYNRYTVADVLDRRLDAAEQVFESWVRKATLEGQGAGRPYWLIISKRDRRRALIFMPLPLLRKLMSAAGEDEHPVPSVLLHSPDFGWVYGTPFEPFLSLLPPDCFHDVWMEEGNDE